MDMYEKCDFLKDTIEKLYTKEGKSKEDIRKLLSLTREPLNKRIQEWGFIRANDHMTVSMKKFIAAHKQQIKSLLRQDVDMVDIAKVIGVSEDKLWRVVRITPELADERDAKKEREHRRFLEREKEQSTLIRDFVDLPGEEWRPILGYDGYFVSSMGRVKAYDKKYDSCHLIHACPNSITGRMYIGLADNNGRRKNLSLHRVVAATFCDGMSPERNTVNHIDGDVKNNTAANLEWVSQSDNLIHSYQTLGRKPNIGRKMEYTIRYQDKFSFKTVAAFARFIGKSETTARRWIEDAENHQITLIHK